MRWLAVGVALSAALNGGLRWLAPRAGVGRELKLEAETAVSTAALLSFGMRRLAADLGLMRLVVYYGSPESEPAAGHEPGDGHDHGGGFDPVHPERFWGGGDYPEIGPRARRILDVDPTLDYAALFASGALAFNLNRPDEALDVLRFALARDPDNLQYRAYAGAIGFHRKGDAAQVIALLEPTLSDPSTPTMIKSMLAFLYRRSGHKRKAVQLYLHILETSRDEGYRGQARRALEELSHKP